MTKDKHDLLSSLDIQGKNPRLERNLLRDQAAEALRDYISTGRIPEGTKLTERDVSQMLGISRMPVHDVGPRPLESFLVECLVEAQEHLNDVNARPW